MKWILLFALLFIPVNAHSATLSLTWSAVTNGADGTPLDPSTPVLQYNVYRCPSAAACTIASAAEQIIVVAPATTLDITAKPRPSNYIVTAVNVVGESAPSNSIKVTPPGSPVISLIAK